MSVTLNPNPNITSYQHIGYGIINDQLIQISLFKKGSCKLRVGRTTERGSIGGEMNHFSGKQGKTVFFDADQANIQKSFSQAHEHITIEYGYLLRPPTMLFFVSHIEIRCKHQLPTSQIPVKK